MSEELDLSKAPLLTHLIELRRRLIYCLLFFAAAFAVSYNFADAAKEAGVSNYIVKPFNAATLKAKLQSVIGAF